jgi:hypothetical protein
MAQAEYSDAAYGQSIVQIASLDQADGGAVIAREILDFTAHWSFLRKIVFRKDGLICW